MSPISVAIIEGVVPSYRLPFLKKLSGCHSLRVVCFHGDGKPGHSVESVGRALPVGSAFIRNLHWPGFGARIAWQTGLWPVFRGDFDVVVCAESVHNLSTWLLLFCSALCNFGIVLSGHGLGTVPRRGLLNKFRMQLRRFLARRAHALLVYTTAGAADCVDHGIDPDKVFISGNTLDTEHLIAIADAVKSDAPKKNEIDSINRNRLNRPGLNLLYVGRLYSAKRVDILIEAAKILRERGSPCRTVIVGEGHQKDELQDLADSVDIEFAGACYDDHALAKYFNDADILVIPDSVGLVVVHAFCNATPILTTVAGTGHGPEFAYIDDNRNGILLQTPTAIDFANKIEALIGQEALLQRLGAGARKTAQSLSMSEMIKQFACAMEFSVRRPSRSEP